MPAVPTRLLHAVEALDVAPNHHVLEIGGGQGVSASLICEILSRGTGRYLGLDRSALATERARARNALHVSAGRAEFQTQDLLQASLPPAAFDRILAVNVNLFWTDPTAPALERLRTSMKRHGLLVLVYEAVSPDLRSLRARERVLRAGLESNRFALTETALQTNASRPRLHLIAGRRA